MSQKQWRTLDVVERIERGELTVTEAAQLLNLSRRQMQRVRARVEQEGRKGVVHGNAGRAPKHKTTQLVRERVVALRKDVHKGFNDQHFTEKLVEVEGLVVSRASVRRILRKAGVGAERGRQLQVECQQIPGMGTMSVFVDPNGARFAIWQDAKKA